LADPPLTTPLVSDVKDSQMNKFPGLRSKGVEVNPWGDNPDCSLKERNITFIHAVTAANALPTRIKITASLSVIS
jgi:hypothetical protein